MENENPRRTLGDYSKPSHEGYQNTIEIPDGNNVVPLRSDIIRWCKMDAHSTKRTRLRLFQFSLRDQASNWLERLPVGSISTWEDLTNRFLAQLFPPGRTFKIRNDILMFQQHQGESLSKAWTRFKELPQKVTHHGIDLWLKIQIFYDHVNPITRRTIDQATCDFAKPVKEISMPQDVPSTSDRRLMELENQVQRLMEAHLAPNQPIQVNKIASSCEICSSPHDTQYYMENFEQAFVEYASSRIDEAGDARITRFESDFKQHQSEIANKLDTLLKAVNDRMTVALPSDTVKNPKLNPNSTSFAHSYPIGDPRSSSNDFKSVNAIQTCFKSTTNIQKDQLQVNTLTVNEIETPKPKEPEESLKDEFADLHLMTSNKVYFIASFIPLIMEYLVKVNYRHAFWSLNEDI
ncbi:MAK10-like protein [Tanacetum coccineum]